MVGVRRRMELIASDKKRELTFQGRVKSMKKKAYELSTLCGLDIGMIICSPSGQIETLSWPNPDDDGKTLNDLIKSSRNHGDKRKKIVTRISKGDTQNQAGEQQLDVKSTQFVSCSSQLGEQSGPSVSCHSQLDMKSEKELRELAMCFDNNIERVKERIQYLEKEKQVTHQPQVADDTSLIEDYGIMHPGDLDYLLNMIMDQPLTPIHEDFGTTWPHDLPSLVQPTATTFASNNDTNCHSNIPSVMTTGGYPMSRQVMIGRAAFQEFTYNSNLQEPQYTNDNVCLQRCTSGDQLSYNPSLWRTPY